MACRRKICSICMPAEPSAPRNGPFSPESKNEPGLWNKPIGQRRQQREISDR